MPSTDTQRTFKSGPASGEAIWRDADGVLHFCEGSQMIPFDKGTFCMWTLCGSADVPAGKAWIKRPEDDVDCENCLHVHDHEMPFSGSMEPKI